MKSAKLHSQIVRHRSRPSAATRTLRYIGLGLFVVLANIGFINVYSYTRAGGGARVQAAVPATMNFQARLLQSNGAIVADGNYSVEFKLYTAASGGAAVWTETQGSITVKSGYLSVYLGDVNNTLGSLDWSQQHWLTMNVNADGEMNPRLRLTSVPYAFRAGQADGITNGAGVLEADDIVQLAPSNVQAVNTALAALRINQQGVGLLAQLQGNGSDVFTISKTGDVNSSGSATFSGGTLNLGTSTQLGGLVLHDGSSNTATIRTGALAQNTVYTLPDAGGASAEICLDTGNCGGTGDIINGGNATGADVTIGTNDAFSLVFETGNVTRLTLDNSGNLDLVNGNFEIGGTAVITSSGVLQNVTANISILTSGLLGTARGGTGVDGSTASNGQLLIGNGSGYVLSTLTQGSGVTITNGAGSITIAAALGNTVGNSEIENDAVTLGTQTTGDYVASIGTLLGLSVSGNSGEGSTPGLSVLYGSASGTAVQGNTTIICPSGTGNLTGGGNTITLGAGRYLRLQSIPLQPLLLVPVLQHR